MTSQVPSITFDSSGVIIPDAADVLTGVLADMSAAFGGDMSTSLSTPQGQLAQTWAAIIDEKNAQIANMLAMVDPSTNSGRWQDAIGRIYMMTRSAGKGTVVDCTCTGQVGTVIPKGSLAQDLSGYLYASTAEATIGSTGTVAVQFQGTTDGPIPCPAGSLSKIYAAVTGWERITNPSDGSEGSLVESRADFEHRRKKSVAANAHGSPAAIYASVFAVDNVVDAYVIDNPTDAVVTKGYTSYPLAKHSVYIAVVGGEDSAIASAIWSKKDLGCDMNGNTSVIVKDTDGYSYPQPEYRITFMRPTAVPVKFVVQIVDDPSLPANISSLIKSAIVARFNGADGDNRERIGTSVRASRYYDAIASTNAYVSVIDVRIGTGSATPTEVQAGIGIDQRPTISDSDISVILVQQ